MINCDENQRSVNKFEIETLPQLILFKSGVKFVYTGNFTAYSIITWAKLRKGPHIYTFEECQEIFQVFNSGLMGPEDSLVIYFPSISQQKIEEETQWNIYYQTVSIIEEIYDKILFAQFKQRDCASIAFDLQDNIKDNKALVMMMRKFDQNTTLIYDDEFADEDFADWLIINSIPPIVEFDPKYMQHVLGASRASIVLFASKEGLMQQEYFQVFQEAAEYYKGTHIFIIADLNDENTYVQTLGDLLGVSEQPQLLVVEPRGQYTLTKYQYDPDKLQVITLDTFKQYMKKFYSNKLVPFWKNEEIKEPSKSDAGIQKINGYEFRDIIIAKLDQFDGEGYEYLIHFYVDWCPHCATVANLLESYFSKRKIPNLFVGSINMSKNEIGFDVRVKAYPSLYFWPLNLPFNESVEFKFQRTEETLDEFLKNHSSSYQQYLESLHRPNQQSTIPKELLVEKDEEEEEVKPEEQKKEIVEIVEEKVEEIREQEEISEGKTSDL